MIKYEKTDGKGTGAPTIFRFESEFDGFLVVDEHKKDSRGVAGAKCFIKTPHGTFLGVCRVNLHFMGDQEAVCVDFLVEDCISKYKKKISEKL